MMLKERINIESVFHEYQSSKDKLIYLSAEGGVISLDLSSLNILWEYKSNVLFYTLLVRDSNLLIFNKVSDVVCLNIENGLLIDSRDNIQDVKLKKVVDGKVLTSNSNKEPNSLVLYDLNSHKKNWEISGNFGSHKFFNNQFVYISLGRRNDKIVSVNRAGEIIWQLDLSEIGKYIDGYGEEVKGEVKGIIGEYNSILYLWVTERKLVALSCEKGEVLWEKTEFDQDISGKENDTKLPYLYNTFLDEKRGVISCLIGETYYEIDLASSTAKCIKNVKEDVPGFQLFVKHTVHEGELIYFTSQKSPETPAIVIGIFDKQKQKVIWTKEVEFETGAFFVEAPKFDEKHVYCLDSEKTLHIFEKEYPC